MYYPSSRYNFVADVWPSSYCNSYSYYGGGGFANNTTIVRNFVTNNNTYYSNSSFVPVNARAGGTILADPASFAGRNGNFRVASGQDAVNAFSRGRFVGAPIAGHQPVSGPQNVRPTTLAMAPTRAFRSNVPVSQAALNRPVYRAPLRS